jgi:hypothetical protein
MSVINVFSGTHSFDEQVALAKAKEKYGSSLWSDNVRMPAKHASGMDSLDAIQTTLADPGFADFVNDSYKSAEGYSIRINPRTGKKEMMVAGTRHSTQWLLNAYDSGLYVADKALKSAANEVLDHTIGELYEDVPFLDDISPKPHIKGIKLFERADPWRQKKQKMYSEIAKENNVDVVYGHSRGGAIVADMNVPSGTQKVGLDAAMLIAHHTGMLNINEGGGLNPLGLFDYAIGLTGEDNVTYDASTFSPHKVWRD